MPVTAKLSRTFYDRLGDEIANELVEWFNQVDATYRGDLRQLNELNFSRFDASVGERFALSDRKFAEFETKVEKRLGEFELRIERRLSAFEVKLETRMGAFEIKMEQRIAALEVKMEQRIAALEVKLEQRLSDFERTFTRKFDAFAWRIFGLMIAQFALIAGLYLK